MIGDSGDNHERLREFPQLGNNPELLCGGENHHSNRSATTDASQLPLVLVVQGCFVLRVIGLLGFEFEREFVKRAGGPWRAGYHWWGGRDRWCGRSWCSVSASVLEWRERGMFGHVSTC
jgi:hypothetical protein